MRRMLSVGALSVVLLTGFTGDDAFPRASAVFYDGLAKAISLDLCKPSAFPADKQQALRAALRTVDQAGLRDSLGVTPMAYAATIDDVDSLERFSKLGDSPEQRLLHNGSVLHLAAQFGSTKSIAWLLAHGMSVDVRDDAGVTPLMWAAGENNLATVRQLLAAGADAKATTKDGRSALNGSMACHDTEMIATLRAAGAPVDDKVRALATKFGVKLD